MKKVRLTQTQQMAVENAKTLLAMVGLATVMLFAGVVVSVKSLFKKGGANK